MYNLRSAIVLLMVASLRDAFRMQNRIVMHQKSKLGILFVSGDVAAGTDDVEEKESDSDRRERLRAKARKMMFNEKGVPYAPWMVRQIDEEVQKQHRYYCMCNCVVQRWPTVVFV